MAYRSTHFFHGALHSTTAVRLLSWYLVYTIHQTQCLHILRRPAIFAPGMYVRDTSSITCEHTIHQTQCLNVIPSPAIFPPGVPDTSYITCEHHTSYGIPGTYSFLMFCLKNCADGSRTPTRPRPVTLRASCTTYRYCIEYQASLWAMYDGKKKRKVLYFYCRSPYIPGI